jgi:hypothetical protein
LAALVGQDIALPAGQQGFLLPHRPALAGEHQLPQPTSKQRETARNNAATDNFGVFCQVIPKLIGIIGASIFSISAGWV